MSIKSDAFEILSAHFESTGEIMDAGKLADRLDTTRTYAYEVRSKWKNEYSVGTPAGSKKTGSPSVDGILDREVEKDFREDKGEFTIKSATIKTYEDAIQESGVDLDIWEPERHIVNYWTVSMKVSNKSMEILDKNKVDFMVEDRYVGDSNYDDALVPIRVTNYQVKVWFKRRVPDVWEESIKSLIAGIPGLELPPVSPYRQTDGDVAAEIALYDAHFGKFAWHPETMMGHWDINICTDAYLNGCERGLQHAGNYSPAKIYFVLGQDFMHVDNSFFKTPHGGHQLDADGRFPKIARKAMETIIRAVNMCREVAPVEVKWVPGNHDIHSSFWLSLILEQAFKGDKFVTVDNAPAQRKAALWGNLLVGWWHDASGRKMPASVNALAQWWPDEWGKSKYRELHIGHKHKKVHTKTMPIETIGGVLIRQIPSLSSIDFWHQDSLFVDAIPASETLLWSKRDGVFGNFTINVAPTLD